MKMELIEFRIDTCKQSNFEYIFVSQHICIVVGLNLHKIENHKKNHKKDIPIKFL